MTTTWTAEQLACDIGEQGDVWVRAAAAIDQGGNWQLSFLEVTAGAAPPSWRRECWRYRTALLIADCWPGTVIAHSLSNKKLTLDELELEVQPFGQPQPSRLDSHSRWGSNDVLSWPSVCVYMTASPNSQIPDGALVADDAPTFYDFGSAAAAFFGRPDPLGQTARSSQGVYRRQDLTGRIVLVRVGATEVLITVEGDSLAGAAVDLARPGGSERRPIESGVSTVTFPLAEPLPSGSWVVLHRGGEWIDRRFLNWPYAISSTPDVEVVVEPESQLEALLSAGEGPSTEFKQELPPKDPTGIRKSFKTVAAFANGDGGALLYGVSDDGCALGVERSRGNEERLADLVRAWISPLPPFEVDVLPVDGDVERAVYRVTVKEGERPPYGCGLKPSELIYYVRRGATTFPVGADEVRALARSRPPAEQSLGGLFGG